MEELTGVRHHQTHLWLLARLAPRGVISVPGDLDYLLIKYVHEDLFGKQADDLHHLLVEAPLFLGAQLRQAVVLLLLQKLLHLLETVALLLRP